MIRFAVLATGFGLASAPSVAAPPFSAESTLGHWNAGTAALAFPIASTTLRVGRPLPHPKRFGTGKATGKAIDKATARRLAKLRFDVAAKRLFGRERKPAVMEAAPIGKYNRGCLAGGVALPINGPGWQVMRLRRNRYYGHPVLIDYMKDLAAKTSGIGWRGLMVGDMTQPRGGPMLTGHRSHQIGLDADIWLKQMPKHTMGKKERENVSAISMLDKTRKAVDPSRWTDAHARLIKAAASDYRVHRIFVHAAIKVALCKWATGDRTWLRVVRPWFGHHYHFHVRLKCPPGSRQCAGQKDPPVGDGCDNTLYSWLKDKPKKKKKPKKKHQKALSAKWKPRIVTLADLPGSCRNVLVSK